MKYSFIFLIALISAIAVFSTIAEGDEEPFSRLKRAVAMASAGSGAFASAGGAYAGAGGAYAGAGGAFAGPGGAYAGPGGAYAGAGPGVHTSTYAGPGSYQSSYGSVNSDGRSSYQSVRTDGSGRQVGVECHHNSDGTGGCRPINGRGFSGTEDPLKNEFRGNQGFASTSTYSDSPRGNGQYQSSYGSVSSDGRSSYGSIHTDGSGRQAGVECRHNSDGTGGCRPLREEGYSGARDTPRDDNRRSDSEARDASRDAHQGRYSGQKDDLNADNRKDQQRMDTRSRTRQEEGRTVEDRNRMGTRRDQRERMH